VPCCCGAGRAAIDRQLLAAGLTAANPPHVAAAGGWDRQADGHRTFQTLLSIICGQCQKQKQKIREIVHQNAMIMYFSLHDEFLSCSMVFCKNTTVQQDLTLLATIV